MTLGEVIDNLYETRAARLTLSKQVEELKQQEAVIREELLRMLNDVGLKKASGELATVGVNTSIQPLTTDWVQIHSYIRNEDRFDLLQKRLATFAWRELYDTGILVPGTEPFEETDLSLTKSTRS